MTRAIQKFLIAPPYLDEGLQAPFRLILSELTYPILKKYYIIWDSEIAKKLIATFKVPYLLVFHKLMTCKIIVSWCIFLH